MFRFMGGSMKKITKALDKPLRELNLKIDSIKYNKGELNIILDSDEIINLDKIVEATNVINKILDENDFIKESYMLDVSSKEKGGVK